MAFIRNIATKPGECCDCDCGDLLNGFVKRDGPCDCCDCCPDVDLPDDVCVYCRVKGSMDSTSGCCTQSYMYHTTQKLTLKENSCDYETAGGEIALTYDTDSGFWKGTFCEESWPATEGCEHYMGKYFNAEGDWVGGVAIGGVLPAEEWLSDCACVEGDPPCECIPDDNPYTYEEIEGCVETSTDPCCLPENRKCPSEEGVAFNPANDVCP